MLTRVCYDCKRAGTGVFMNTDFHYNPLHCAKPIGNYNRSSTSSRGKLYHIGTVPSSKGNTYVADLRMMVSSTVEGIRPFYLCPARRQPTADHIEEGANSWDMLGTNLPLWGRR